MPRYFFETLNNDVFLGNDGGIELKGPKAARIEALKALPDMARDEIPDGDQRTLVSIVRDEKGDIVFEGKLTLEGKWHKKPDGC